MNPYPLFFHPVLKERIWGGNWLQKAFDYPLTSDHTGECWAVSAHPHGPSIVKNGPLSGQHLDTVWRQYPQWFGEKADGPFPLLVKIIDAAADLSVQVHPDDRMAQQLENERMGKTECWYVLEAEPGASIVYGHHAQNHAELRRMIADGRWDQLLRDVPVRQGDFIYVPAGTVHALGKGIRVLEIQQSSDITYRLYDYDRQENGKPRPLHIEQALQVIQVPFTPPDTHAMTDAHAHQTHITYDTGPYFQVAYHRLADHPAGKGLIFHPKDHDALFLTLSLLSGEGQLSYPDSMAGQQVWPVRKGDHILLPGQISTIKVTGSVEMVTAVVPNA